MAEIASLIRREFERNPASTRQHPVLSAAERNGPVLVVLAGLLGVALVRLWDGLTSSAGSSVVGTLGWLDGEYGIIEIVTVVLLVPAVALALATLTWPRIRSSGLLMAWLVAHGAGALYFAGEEISWGQHLFAWETGEWFRQVNDQNETNLHNISSWLDQKPRSLLLLWILLAGALWPLVERRRGYLDEDGFLGKVLPTRELVPLSLTVVLVRAPHYLADAFDLAKGGLARQVVEPINLTEVQECLFAVFILLYVIALRRRLRRVA